MAALRPTRRAIYVLVAALAVGGATVPAAGPAGAHHNRLMAKYDTLSHQLPGEPSFGARITAVGYSWRAIGENCAWTTSWSLAGVLAMHTRLYNEVAPNDAHRRNILSSTFRDVGVDIVMDAAHGRAWLTEEFAAPL